MSRKDFLDNHVGYSKLIAHHQYRDCDEFAVERWGDLCVFRVYGNSEKDYYIVER